MTGTKLFVMLGYGEDFGLGVSSLNFTTNGMLINEACDIVRLVKEYNNYEGREVAKVLREISELWPSEHQQVTFRFGREHSPVLYVHFPYWKSNTERFENREELIKKSIDLLKTVHPDELNDDKVGFETRVWWD